MAAAMQALSIRIGAPLWRSFVTLGWTGKSGLGLLLIIVLIAIFAPHLAPYDPNTFTGNPLEEPSADHQLGTNDVGQDIFSELIYGTRISLLVAVGAGLGTVILALLVGGISGYVGGWIDAILMRVVDIALALPRLPLLILVTVFIGVGVEQMILVISLLFWPGTARIIRTQVQHLRQHAYISMAQQFGASHFYAFLRHIFPQLIPLLSVGWVTAAGRAVAMEAGLAFLGIGDPSAKSWGLMMRYAMNLPGLLLTDRWQWWLLPPGICITVLILALTLTGIGLENQIDQRMILQ